MKYTESQICKMVTPISQSEGEKCKRAIRIVRDAMKKLNYSDDGKEIRSYIAESYSYVLDLRQQNTGKKITLLVQGSYANKAKQFKPTYSQILDDLGANLPPLFCELGIQ